MAVRPKTADLPGSKARGWASLIASVLVIVVICGIAVFLGAAMFAPGVRFTPGNGAIFGALAIGFAMFIAGGVLGVFNGIGQIRTGRRSKPLTIAIMVIMPMAFVVVLFGALLQR